MEFQEVIRRRRMVRNFSDEPVAREVIERIAAIAQRAPSAGFSQGQRLIAVTDEALRRRLAEHSGEAGYDEAGFGRWISAAPVQFVPCVSEKIYRDRYDEPDKHQPGDEQMEWPIPYWWMDIGCTVENLLLAARRPTTLAVARLRSTRVWPQALPDRRTSTGSGPPSTSRPTSLRSVSSRLVTRCPTSAHRR